jgi:hypothetical protein
MNQSFFPAPTTDCMILTRMHATDTRFAVTTSLYATPKHSRQTTTNSAHGEERQGVWGMPHNPS